jgi:hypothetical protein
MTRTLTLLALFTGFSKPPRFGASWPESLGRVGRLMEGTPVPFHRVQEMRYS